MNRKPEALIFDFDGVVADTEPLYWKAWATILAMHGIEFSWEDRFMLAPHARPGNNPPAPSAGTAANSTASVAPSRRAASEAECRQHRRRVSRDGCRDFHLIDGKPGILQPVAGEDTDHSGAFRHSELQQTGHRRSRSGLAED